MERLLLIPRAEGYTAEQKLLLDQFELIIQKRESRTLNENQRINVENEHIGLAQSCIDAGLIGELGQMRDNLQILKDYAIIQ